MEHIRTIMMTISEKKKLRPKEMDVKMLNDK